MTRAEIITRVRDYIYEDVANIFTDAQLQRFFLEELRALPSKGVYKEEVWTTTLVVNQQSYTLPSGVVKLEKFERNDGTSTYPAWNSLGAYDVYGETLYLDWLPGKADSVRGLLRMKFADVTDDTTALEIADDKSEILVWGIVVRCYKAIIGYKNNSKSWDSVTKPGDVSLSALQSWIRDAKEEQKELIKQYSTVARPRNIDLVS
jgi:hypothetical protein